MAVLLFWASYVVMGVIIGALLFVYWRRVYLTHVLVAINFFVFILMLVVYFIDLEDWIQMYGDLCFKPIYLTSGENIYTLVTSLFVHVDPFHVLMNMVILFLIGVPFEERIGSMSIGVIYFFTGIVAAIVYSIFNLHCTIFLVGASGAIFGILGCFATMYPRDEIPMYLGFIFLPRVQVLLVAIILGVVETLYLVSTRRDNVAHLAHLGGLVCGIVMAPIMLKIRGAKGVARETLDYNVLQSLATTSELREMLERAKSEEEREVKKAWLEHFLSKTKCPKCNRKLAVKGRKIECSCGYKNKY